MRTFSEKNSARSTHWRHSSFLAWQCKQTLSKMTELNVMPELDCFCSRNSGLSSLLKQLLWLFHKSPMCWFIPFYIKITPSEGFLSIPKFRPFLTICSFSWKCLHWNHRNGERLPLDAKSQLLCWDSRPRPCVALERSALGRTGRSRAECLKFTLKNVWQLKLEVGLGTSF